MQFRVSHRRADMTPRKVRYVVDLIRGKDVNRAFDILAFTEKRATRYVRRLLTSAVANASQVSGVNVNKLFVSEARVDGGPIYPSRFMPGPMGRALPVRRRTSHIHLALSERTDGAKQTEAKEAPAAQSAPVKEKKESKAKAPAAAKKTKKDKK